MKKILIIVDAQYDFLDGGKLGVDGAKATMNRLSVYINEHYKDYDAIILTADWHLPSHCSFKENGGIWPPHCIQFSNGAAIYEPILNMLNYHKVDYTILTKGCDEDHEEYSVFKNEKSCNYLKAFKDVETVDFCGIALNYCLKDSAIDSKKVFTKANIRVLKSYCPSIGDPTEAIKTLEDNNIELI